MVTAKTSSTKNSKHIINLIDQFQLNLPSQKPTSHTFCRNMRYGTSIVMYEAMLDHFLISKNLVSKVIKSKVISQTIVYPTFSSNYPSNYTNSPKMTRANAPKKHPK